MGQPPFGTTIDKAVITDTRKIGNPHANDYYTYGKRQEIKNGRFTNDRRAITTSQST